MFNQINYKFGINLFCTATYFMLAYIDNIVL